MRSSRWHGSRLPFGPEFRLPPPLDMPIPEPARHPGRRLAYAPLPLYPTAGWRHAAPPGRRSTDGRGRAVGRTRRSPSQQDARRPGCYRTRHRPRLSCWNGDRGTARAGSRDRTPRHRAGAALRGRRAPRAWRTRQRCKSDASARTRRDTPAMRSTYRRDRLAWLDPARTRTKGHSPAGCRDVG